MLRLSGYRLPNEPDTTAASTVSGALFADLTDDERDELLEYLAWYRTRQGIEAWRQRRELTAR